MATTYDVIIIGSGPAGYTAALYAARANLSVLMIRGYESGGQLMLTTDVENYPGFEDGILGPDLMEHMEKQARRFGTEMRDEDVSRLGTDRRPFEVYTELSEEPALGRSIIISTGASARWLGLESETHLRNR